MTIDNCINLNLLNKFCKEDACIFGYLSSFAFSNLKMFVRIFKVIYRMLPAILFCNCGFSSHIHAFKKYHTHSLKALSGAYFTCPIFFIVVFIIIYLFASLFSFYSFLLFCLMLLEILRSR